jgi:hypothetical protein
MTGNGPLLTDMERRGHRSAPNSGIAGLVEGSMTTLPEPGGGVSFRVLISVGGKQAAAADLLELIISAEHIVDLSRALAGYGAGVASGLDPMLALPCHIGFSRNVLGPQPGQHRISPPIVLSAAVQALAGRKLRMPHQRWR